MSHLPPGRLYISVHHPVLHELIHDIGTHVVWGVNFGQNNLTAAFLEAQAIKNAFDTAAVKLAGVTLEFVEIGNEADLYPNNGARDGSFNVAEYTTEYGSHILKLVNMFNLKIGGQISRLTYPSQPE